MAELPRGALVKAYAELTEAQQESARDTALVRLLEDVCNGMRFNDALNGDNLQARIDAALARADAMQTPWFAHEYVLDTCRADLEAMALCDAEDALYRFPCDAPVYTLDGDA